MAPGTRRLGHHAAGRRCPFPLPAPPGRRPGRGQPPDRAMNRHHPPLCPPAIDAGDSEQRRKTMLTDAQRAAVAAGLQRGRTAGRAGIPRRAAEQADLPLSFAQEQLWLLDKLAPGLPTYNVPQALRLSGPLDAAALIEAITKLAARHEALRTRLVTGARGEPLQVIDPAAAVPVDLSDLSGLAEPSRSA